MRYKRNKVFEALTNFEILFLWRLGTYHVLTTEKFFILFIVQLQSGFSQEPIEISNSLLAHHLLRDIVQFFWMPAVTQIQWNKHRWFCVWRLSLRLKRLIFSESIFYKLTVIYIFWENLGKKLVSHLSVPDKKVKNCTTFYKSDSSTEIRFLTAISSATEILKIAVSKLPCSVGVLSERAKY